MIRFLRSLSIWHLTGTIAFIFGVYAAYLYVATGDSPQAERAGTVAMFAVAITFFFALVLG
jgi:hypothetical protein